MSNPFNDLFRYYAIPPSRLHEAMQEAARQEGWVPPWDRKEQKSKNKLAGRKSGLSRAGRAEMRRSFLNLARMQLNHEHRRAPYSNAAIAALEEKYRNLLAKELDDPNVLISSMLSVLSKADRKALKNASSDTLIKDLKIIRKMRGVRRLEKA
jgi:hypothetical protein